MASLIEKIKDLGFLPKGGSVIGVDIGGSAIKIVQIKEDKGRAILENYGSIALGPYGGQEVGQAVSLPEDKTIEAFNDLIQEAKFTTKRAAISIPLGASLLSLIQVPSVDKKQLEGLIPIEARKYIPVSISEVTLDWYVIPEAEGGDKKQGGSREVLIAAIHNGTIEKYQRIKDAVKIEAELFELEIFGAIRSVVGRDMAPIMILDMGAGTTKLAMVEYGIVRKQHIINRGSQDVTLALSRATSSNAIDAEQVKREVGLLKERGREELAEVMSLPMGDIFAEASRVLLEYQKGYNKTISKVILTGGGVLIKDIVPLAKRYFEAEVEVGDPFSKLEHPAFLRETLKKAGPEFAVAIGVALKALQG